MASKSGARNGRDSNSQRLGVKCSGGAPVQAGAIIIRQRGTRVMPGRNVRRGSDDTLFALKAGVVTFQKAGKYVSVVEAKPATA